MAKEHLIVVGSGPLAWEVARLGVAYGADVSFLGPTNEPPTDEPWTRGVRWLAHEIGAAVPSGVSAGSVVWADEALPAELGDDPRFDRRLVVVNQAAAVEADHVVRVVTGPVDVSPLDEISIASAEHSDTLRVETAAMALLRLAIEETAPSDVDRATLAYLGDAVMWQ